MLQADESFQNWQESEHSCLLALCGQNRTWDNATTLSWLSAAAVIVTEQLRGAKRLVAYYYCQVQLNMSDQRRPPLQELMAYLVYQIIASRPELMQIGSHKIKTAVSCDEWREINEEVALEVMRACLMDLLGLFQADEEITLVLDRVDRCCYGDEALSGQVLLMQFLELVFEAPCILNILVVANSTSWKIRADQRERLRRKGGNNFVDKLEWHQERNHPTTLTRSRRARVRN